MSKTNLYGFQDEIEGLIREIGNAMPTSDVTGDGYNDEEDRYTTALGLVAEKLTDAVNKNKLAVIHEDNWWKDESLEET